MNRQIWAARNTEKLENPSSYNEGIRKSWMPFWTKNAAENYARIKDEFKKETRDATIFVGREHHPHVLLVGSGPSLNDWEPLFKDWEGDIMISSSHLVYFEAIGVKPTFCFIIDADPSMTHLVTEADTSDITLVTHPNMDPVILDKWQGPIVYFRMFDPGDEFFKDVMPMVYSDFMDYETKEKYAGIRSYVLNSGNVTNCMIAMCTFWQYKNVFLCGVDLGFPKGEIEDQYRFVGYKRVGDGFEREEPMPIPKERILYEGNNGVKTDQVSCFYKYSTMILWGMDNSNIYSCSRGILTEIPYIPPKDVLACQGDIPDSYFVPNDKKYILAQQYLQYRGIYIMKGLPRVTQKKAKNFKRTKKRLMRYQLIMGKLFGTKVMDAVGNKRRIKYGPQIRKHIIHTMHSSPAIKFRFYFWEWMWTKEGIKTRARLQYTAITNKYSEKKSKRWRLVLKFHLGKMVGLW